jgi:hypothetical protein
MNTEPVNEDHKPDLEVRGGDRPTDYIRPVPPARPLRADADEDEYPEDWNDGWNDES